MNYIELIKHLDNNNMDFLNGKLTSELSTAMACEIMQRVISNSYNKYFGISDSQFLKLSDELGELKTTLIKSTDLKGQDYLDSLKDSAYLCKRVLKIGSLLKSNSDSTFNQDLFIAYNLSEVSFNGLVSLLKNELRLVAGGQRKKELESHIEILAKEDEFYKSIMDSPDY